MHTNPNNEIIGPTVIRRKEKISGLYTSPEGSPAIRANPRIMITKEIAIRMRLSVGKCFITRNIEILNFVQRVIIHTDIFPRCNQRRKKSDQDSGAEHNDGYKRDILPRQREENHP